MPSHEVTPYVPPAPSAGPIDNLQAKRDRQAFLDSAFTRDQQRAIGMILENWWGMKMAGVETQRVAEAVEEHPKRLAALENAVAELQRGVETAVNEALLNEQIERGEMEDQ